MSSKEETRERGNIGKTHSLTNSRPITPAPITTSFLGTADKESAPVDDTMVFSSICKNQTLSNNSEMENSFVTEKQFV